ncbi:MAG: OmpA family protein [Alphaproteobacteria bacterium]|nr:OmpA family protein [Alphaproteobacteria bacterium]MCW5742430.1 OmpA family protein [Alphaproteobacteria bacterium]
MTRMGARRLGLSAALCALSGVVIALPAEAQQRIDRCQMHIAIGRNIPAECGGAGGAGTATRGRVVIGKPDSGAAKPPAGGQPGTAAPAPGTVAPAAGAAPPVDRAPPTRSAPYSLSLPILFEFDSDRLTAAASRLLDDLADVLKRNPSDRFIIEGHTDAVGADDYNMDLSQRRARAVVEYLATRHAIDRARLESVGLGRTKLSVPNQPADPRNRRVQILNVGT